MVWIDINPIRTSDLASDSFAKVEQLTFASVKFPKTDRQ